MVMEIEIKFRAAGGAWKTMKYECKELSIDRPTVEVTEPWDPYRNWKPGPDLIFTLRDITKRD